MAPKSLVQNFHKELKALSPSPSIQNKIHIFSYNQILLLVQKKNVSFSHSLIIVDEAHNFRGSVENSSMKNLFKITSAAKEVLLLSATPVQNYPSDFASLYAILTNREKEYQHNPESIISLFENFKKLPSLKGLVSYVKSKKTNFPEVREKKVVFHMSPSFYDQYMKIEKGFKHKELGDNLKVFLNGVRRACNKIDSNTESPKIRFVTSFLKKYRSQKTLIYSGWVENGLVTLQKKLREKYVSISGATSAKKREEYV